jgi:hypothetical protein
MSRKPSAPQRPRSVPTAPTPDATPGNIASAAPLIRAAMDRGEIFRANSFDLACAQNRIKHRLAKLYRPWTNDQVGRTKRTLKEPTVLPWTTRTFTCRCATAISASVNFDFFIAIHPSPGPNLNRSFPGQGRPGNGGQVNFNASITQGTWKRHRGAATSR